MLLKSSKNSSIWHPKSLPNWSQIDLGAHFGGREICSGRLWPLGRLLARSWTRMGPKKTNWNRLLDGPRPPRRSVSACLGAKCPPKRVPRRVQNRGPKTIQAGNGKTLIFNDSCKDSNDFSGARGLFGGPKMGPKWGPNRIFDAEGLGIALGSLLERSWRLLEPKKQLGSGSWAAKRRIKTRFQHPRGVRPGQHWERKAHHLEIERSDRLFCIMRKSRPSTTLV